MSIEMNVDNFDKTTLASIYHPLMQSPSMKADRCFICGRSEPLEQHHFVWRSWGEYYRNGYKIQKPTITLCGRGNNLKDSRGRPYCHGLAHHRRLHFKFVPAQMDVGNAFQDSVAFGGGRLHYLMTDKPTDYMTALEMDGWKPVKLPREDWR